MFSMTVMMRYPKREKLTVWMLLPLLLGSAALPVGATESAGDAAAATMHREASHALRVQRAEVLAQVYAAAGMEQKTAFSYAWAALCAERDGKGNADELLAEMVRRGNLDEILRDLSPNDVAELQTALESVGAKPEGESTGMAAALKALLLSFRNQDAAKDLATAGGTATATFDHRSQAVNTTRSEAPFMPSVWWLKNFSGSILQTEPMTPGLEPPPSAGSDGIQVEEAEPTPQPDTTEDAPTTTTLSTETTESQPTTLSLASFGGGDTGFAAPRMMRMMAMPLADEPTTIEVADGTTQSVMSPTEVYSVTLGSNSTLYVADTLTLSHELKVQNDSCLVVKDGGVVQLGTYSDSQSAATNKNVALLFDALLHSATTEGSGVVKIDSVSVQFGDGSAYNLADKNGLNAVFNARYEIEKDLQLQNYNQGLAHSKNPTQTAASSWQISESGDVHVKGDLKLSSYQQMDVSGGKLVVDGTTLLGHTAGSAYAAKLTIEDGSYVQLNQIGDARTQQDGKSELVMTGGELVFTADGNVVTNKLGGITLSGGELVADGHSWVLNHNATLGSDEGLSIRTDADNSVTLGMAGTTTTLAGQVSVSQGSNAALNGTYAGTGTVELGDGASLTLGQNFSTAAGSSVGLSGTGSVQVNWTGDMDALHDGFMSSYGITYRPAGIATGSLNLEHAANLVWKDKAGNILHDVIYEDGALKGQVNVDPTVYRIVTEGHTATFDKGGNAEGATAFRLHNNGTLFIGEGYSVTADQVMQNNYTLTLEGSGRYDLGTISKVQDFKLPGKLVFGDDWTGIIRLDGQGKELGFSSASWATWGMDGAGYRWDDMVRLDANGKAQSWLELAGVKSFFNPDGASPYNHTIAANLIFAEGQALTINNGFGGRTITFTGDMAGTGTFEHTPNANETYTFSGDISAWTGQFLKSAGGTAKLILSGNAHEVNAVINRTGGTLNMSIETDTKLNANVTVNDLSIDADKSVEVGRDAVVNLTLGTYGVDKFTRFVDAMSGAGVVQMKGASYAMPAAGQHEVKTNFVFTGGLSLSGAATTWQIAADTPSAEQTAPVKDGSLTLSSGHLWLQQNQTLSIDGGAVTVAQGDVQLGYYGVGSSLSMSSGNLTTRGILINSAPSAVTVSMTGGTLNITGSTFAAAGSAAGAAVTLSGGTLSADNHAWTLNYNSTIGPVSIVTQGESGGITLGTQGVTTTLTDVVDNRGNLTLDGTMKLTMDTSNKAYGFVDAAGTINYSGVGFDAEITMPGTVYHVVSGNAAAKGENLTWKDASGTALEVVYDQTTRAGQAALYFDGFNLRPVNDPENPEATRTGTLYHMGARGDYTMSAADAAIATGIELTGRGGTLHVGTTPTNTVSLDLAAGQLVLENGADITVGKGQNWAMEAGASVVLGEGSVLTLPGVWGETTPNSYTNSYSVYHLLHNTTGAGKVVFEGDVSWQFGNAGHNTVSTGGYNILDEYGAEDGVNADITFDLEVNGNMLIQNYRQGKDHPDPGSQWKVSEGGSLTVHGNFDSSSYQKVYVEGGDLVVDGIYKIGHEAGRQYEGDLELKSGSLTVGTLETEHEDTSTVHISGGKLTVTQGNAFANTFREASAHDAEFEGTWTWNHDAAIGNITVTEGSAITLGTADTTLTLESPLKNHGTLTLDGTIKADVQKQEGAWSYGTEETGYTPDGDGYYKRTDDLYTLISEGNDAALGANITFILNGETLDAEDFHWNGKAIGMGGTEAGTVYYLNTANGYTYTDADTRTTAFELVNTGATLRLERDPAGLETIHALGGTVSLGRGVRLESALLDAENTVTMAGEGTYLLSNNALMAHPAAHRVSFADAAWTGTVQMSGMLGTEGTLNGLGNAGSWVEMQGVFGADAAPSMEVNVKLTDNGREAAWIYTGDGHDVAFTGDWAGNGTFVFAPVGGASQQLSYSGDLSAWNGAFSAQGGTAQLHVAGDAHEVNAAMQQAGGRIELTAETDTHFTNTTQAAVYAAKGGNLVAEHAEASAIDTLRATGGDVTLKGLAENASITLEELVIGDRHRVRTEGAEPPEEEPLPELTAHITITGEQGQLTAGEAAGLYTGKLSIESGATLNLADRTQGLQLSGALSLGGGGDIRLDDAMTTTLKETGRLVLFTGVTELTLADGTVISGELTPLDNVEAETYFSGLLERLNANGTGETYYLTFHATENGGTVCIETPEPAPGALSLLALLGMAFRRRRA